MPWRECSKMDELPPRHRNWGAPKIREKLRRLFAQLPKVKTVEDFEMLLPFEKAWLLIAQIKAPKLQ
jgi:hypothetical protein